MVITRPTPNWIIVSILSCMALIGFWRGFQDSMNNTRCIGATPGQNNPFPQVVIQPAKPVTPPTVEPEVADDPVPVETPAAKTPDVKVAAKPAATQPDLEAEAPRKPDPVAAAPVEPPSEAAPPAQELPY